jgi:tetratricopeptide (TPR) repeat protein
MVTGAAVLLAAATAAGGWADDYTRGVALVQEGRGAEARVALEKALRARPEAALDVALMGATRGDYLPQLYLAVASHMAGDIAGARRQFEAAERDGKAAQSATGRPLLEAYRLLLAPAVASSGQARSYREFERKPVVLSDDKHREVRAEVLSRCQLRPETENAQAPWYFHYELGLRLLAEGDPQRALDALIDAATRRPDPQRDARTYGMWFTDYRPYFQIARAHARLQNWDCAKNALALSSKTRELSERDREFAEFRELLAETDQKAK